MLRRLQMRAFRARATVDRRGAAVDQALHECRRPRERSWCTCRGRFADALEHARAGGWMRLTCFDWRGHSRRPPRCSRLGRGRDWWRAGCALSQGPADLLVQPPLPGYPRSRERTASTVALDSHRNQSGTDAATRRRPRPGLTRVRAGSLPAAAKTTFKTLLNGSRCVYEPASLVDGNRDRWPMSARSSGFAGSTLAMFAGCSGLDRPSFQMQAQQQTNWCWASRRASHDAASTDWCEVATASSGAQIASRRRYPQRTGTLNRSRWAATDTWI